MQRTSLWIIGEDVMEAVDRPSKDEVLLPLNKHGEGRGLCCMLLLLSKLHALSGSWAQDAEEDATELSTSEACRLCLGPAVTCKTLQAYFTWKSVRRWSGDWDGTGLNIRHFLWSLPATWYGSGPAHIWHQLSKPHCIVSSFSCRPSRKPGVHT